MRFRPSIFAALLPLGCALGGCATISKPPDAATLTLNEPYWDRVNVEVVITRRADCDSRDEGYIETQHLSMRKNKTETITVPNGATVCWRRDRNPSNPTPNVWSGWTKAIVNPGQSADANL